MPRTKVSKSSKRNREASQREEKIREFDSSIDQFQSTMEIMATDFIKDIESAGDMLMRRISKKLLKMKMGEFLELSSATSADWTLPVPTQNSSIMGHSNSSSQSLCSTSSMLRNPKTTNPNDEGYLTEDSATGSSSAGSLAALTNRSQLQVSQQQQLRGRTPGPLCSAKARRTRRSKSVCDYVPGSAIKQKPPSSASQSSEHSSRSKLRTPMASRTKAFSADRSSKFPSLPVSPPAIMRWPKPGEMVMSISGSPVVAQVLPNTFANVNIPVRNGVLSLRPVCLGESELKKDLIEGIEPETLNEIITLRETLNQIVDMAGKHKKAVTSSQIH